MTWFIPDFHHAFYGGIFTILRFADHFKRLHGVRSQFALIGTMDARVIADRIGNAFPALAGSVVHRIGSDLALADLEETDAAIATLWITAYFVLRFNRTKRKFYFLQDYEPLFYPAGSTYAQVETTYRFGFHGVANTPPIAQAYEAASGGVAESFLPCVDTALFHPAPEEAPASAPYTVFFYGRPGHPRNGFELGAQALRKLKRDLGDRVRIVSAGAVWEPHNVDLDGVVENLGLLPYWETAELYRRCDVGIAMMFTRHPSYLPFELMASGALVVSNRNPATAWLLKDRENCLLAEPSATYITEVVEHGLFDTALRSRITARAADTIKSYHGDWGSQIEKIYQFMCQPSRAGLAGRFQNEAVLAGAE